MTNTFEAKKPIRLQIREREAACNTTDQIDEGNEVPLMLPSFPSRVSSSLSLDHAFTDHERVCVCVATTYACIDARACMCVLMLAITFDCDQSAGDCCSSSGGRRTRMIAGS